MSNSASVATELKYCHLHVNGKKQTSHGKLVTQYNPATGEPAAEIPYCTSDEVDAAIAASQAAFPAWSKTPVLQRARILFHFLDLFENHPPHLLSSTPQ